MADNEHNGDNDNDFSPHEEGGWREYRRWVLTELRRLDRTARELTNKIDKTNQMLAALNDRMKPVVILVYGFVGLVMTTVIGAILGLVMIKTGIGK